MSLQGKRALGPGPPEVGPGFSLSCDKDLELGTKVLKSIFSRAGRRGLLEEPRARH